MHHGLLTYSCGNSSLLPVALRRWIFAFPAELVVVELSTQLGEQGDGNDGPHQASIQRHTCKQIGTPTFFFLIHHYQFPPVAFPLSEQGSTQGKSESDLAGGDSEWGVNKQSPAARRSDVTPGAVTAALQ